MKVGRRAQWYYINTIINLLCSDKVEIMQRKMEGERSEGREAEQAHWLLYSPYVKANGIKMLWEQNGACDVKDESKYYKPKIRHKYNSNKKYYKWQGRHF